MRILLDTNVVLDVLLDRRPHSTDAALVFQLIEESTVKGLLCATTLTTIDYLLTQSLNRREARKHLTQLIRLFEIAPVNRAVIESAMNGKLDDFEDAVLDQAACQSGADAIITRDAKGFVHASSSVLDPRQLLVQIKGPLP